MTPKRTAMALMLTGLLGAAGAARAEPPEVLLSCLTTGGKKLSLAYLPGDKPSFHYRFGPATTPDLDLTRRADQITASAPWRGVGRSITSGITFENAGYSYTVWTNYDRLAEEADPVTGGVIVRQGEETIAAIDCAARPAPQISSAFGIEDAMSDAGLVFDEARGAWVPE